jgi:hypothetical protein
MNRKLLGIACMMSLLTSAALAADTGAAPANLTAAEIVNKNVAARGGLQAWKGVKTLRWDGTIGVGGNQRGPQPVIQQNKREAKLPTDPRPADEVRLPFVMEMERPRKVRFEIKFRGETAIQVYDGANGWKLRPYLNRREVENFTSDELKKAAMQSELDGPLVDYQAKGTQVALEGTEKVEGNETYRLKLTTKAGYSFHVWIDAKTFLEAKIQGQPRQLDGREHQVEVYYRDYHNVDGLQIPFVLESHVVPLASAGSRVAETPYAPEKIIITKAIVNPPLPDALFAKLQPNDGIAPAVVPASAHPAQSAR